MGAEVIRAAADAGRGRVCFHAPNLYPVVAAGSIPQAGGAEVQQWILATGLARLGFRVGAVVCDYGQPRRVEREGVVLLRAFPAYGGIPVLRFFHPRLTLAVRALIEANADVYVARGAAMGAGLAHDVARLMGRRFAFMAAHDGDTTRELPDLRHPRDRWWYRRALRGADAIVLQSETQRRRLSEEYGLAGEVLGNPVPLPPEPVDAGRDGAVLWLATYKAAKRPEWFVELARRLPRRRFVMAGVIPEPPLGREAWEAAVAAGRELPNLEVIGYVERSRLPALFGRAALFVHTSPVEGFPNTMLEAWASGLPSVSVVSPDGVVEREGLGEVVGTIDEMAAAVERWMADPEARRAAGARARAHCARRHDPDALCARLGAILDGVIRPPGRSRAPVSATAPRGAAPGR